MATGMDVYISRPVDMAELKKALRENPAAEPSPDWSH
jgi:hypothetical protein